MSGHIVAIGGGDHDRRLDDYILRLTRKARPRVCFLGTASGDSLTFRHAFSRAMSEYDCRPCELTFFEREVEDLATFVDEVDVFWVGGGSTANLLAVWRLHGLDVLLRDAWEAGAVLCGVSAGMNCWFEASTTDSFGPLAPLHDGLGFLEGSACPHYDSEEGRRPLFRGLVDAGVMPPGWACDDRAALHFHAGDVRALSLGGTAYRVEPGSERALEAEEL